MKNLQKYNITNIHRIHHEKCSIMFIHDLKKKNLGYTQINRLLLFDLRRKQNNALFNNMLPMYQKKINTANETTNITNKKQEF